MSGLHGSLPPPRCRELLYEQRADPRPHGTELQRDDDAEQRGSLHGVRRDLGGRPLCGGRGGTPSPGGGGYRHAGGYPSCAEGLRRGGHRPEERSHLPPDRSPCGPCGVAEAVRRGPTRTGRCRNGPSRGGDGEFRGDHRGGGTSGSGGRPSRGPPRRNRRSQRHECDGGRVRARTGDSGLSDPPGQSHAGWGSPPPSGPEVGQRGSGDRPRESGIDPFEPREDPCLRGVVSGGHLLYHAGGACRGLDRGKRPLLRNGRGGWGGGLRPFHGPLPDRKLPRDRPCRGFALPAAGQLRERHCHPRGGWPQPR